MSPTDGLDSFFLLVLQRSALGAILVVVLLILGRLFRSRISPRIWFLLWLLVPIQLLFCISVPSSFSFANLFPQKHAAPVIKENIQETVQDVVPPAAIDVPAITAEPDDEIALFDASVPDAELKTSIMPQPSVEKSQNTGAFPFKYLAMLWGSGFCCFFGVLLFQILGFR